jgi:hypothetical protein
MLTTTTLPPPSNHRGHTSALEQAEQLQVGEYIKLDFATQPEAKSAKISLYQAIRRRELAGIQALLRGNSVYVGRSK